MKFVHETITGYRVEFDEPDATTHAFLDRVRKAASDPCVSENDLIALVYSDQNPILEPGPVPGRGYVTKSTLENPIYRVLIDLRDRKAIAQHGLDVEAMASRYTLTVQEAAERIGIHAEGVRQAIQARRLPSWVKDGRHYLPPDAVEAFKLTRGAKSGGKE